MDYIKVIDDFSRYKGKYFDESWYTNVIESNSDGYYIDNDGCKKVLFKFRKNKISQNLQNLAIDCFLKESKKKHSNRGIAGGLLPGNKNVRTITKTGQNEGQYISSNIFGYYDRSLREHRGLFESQVVCRKTAFLVNNENKWKGSLPFLQRCSKEYCKLAKKEWNIQKKEYLRIHKNLRIPETVFTTVTSNYNWRTACHKDTGDFSKGLGNLIVTGNNFDGGYLGFPQFKVLIKIKPGDFLLMDVHQWHCNTKLKIHHSGFRLSFVMYIREDMSKCQDKSKEIPEYYIPPI